MALMLRKDPKRRMGHMDPTPHKDQLNHKDQPRMDQLHRTGLTDQRGLATRTDQLNHTPHSPRPRSCQPSLFHHNTSCRLLPGLQQR